MRVRHLIAAALLLTAAVCVPATAQAYNEGGSVDASLTACPSCHGSSVDSMTSGPHGGYVTTSKKCAACHDLHKGSAAGALLMPRATVKDTCNMCHDGTGGKGVYGVLAARGVSVVARHRIDTTRNVPGGNGQTGNDATMTFSGMGGTLTCSDCHAPHGSDLEVFTGDRKRTATDTTFVSNRLLKQRPGDIGYDVNKYGSDWCGGCRKGRLWWIGNPVHNHPVETSRSAGGNYYSYERCAILSTDAVTGVATTGTIGRSNRAFLMLYPRTAAPYAGHDGPVCQQCHEDARQVGRLASTGATADAAPFVTASADGTSATDNPRTQVFPHESSQTAFLVETNDNLCLNCHPIDAIP